MRSMSTADEPRVYQRHHTLRVGVVLVSPFPPRGGDSADFAQGLVDALRSAAPDLRTAVWCRTDLRWPSTSP
jgi:hypothetical protein